MTRLADRKTRSLAETAARWRGRPLVIELGAHALTIREKGRRSGFEVDYESIFAVGAKKAAEAKRAERRAKKGNR